MKHQIIIHIGAGKTGTSAIQQFLKNNAETLNNKGIIIPTSNFQKQGNITGELVWYFSRLIKDYEYNAARVKLQTDIEEFISYSEEKYPNTGPKTLLISAENLSNNDLAYKLFEGLGKFYDLKVYFYIRRQDSYLISAWQQWYLKVNDDFWSWLLRVVGHLANWRIIIEKYLEIIHKDNINVEIFERSKLIGGDIVEDFITKIGLNINEFDFDKTTIINPSINHKIEKIIEGSHKSYFTGAHDNDFYNFLLDYSSSSKKGKSSDNLTYKQKIAILNRYKINNEWIKTQFFPELKGPIFTPPKNTDALKQDNKENNEYLFNVLFELVFKLYKQVNSKKE